MRPQAATEVAEASSLTASSTADRYSGVYEAGYAQQPGLCTGGLACGQELACKLQALRVLITAVVRRTLVTGCDDEKARYFSFEAGSSPLHHPQELW